MKTILVTGPIGSGKSAVCRILAELGYPVYDCDSRTKMLYSLVPGLKCSIEERLGLPFERLGEVFSDPSKLSELEAMVYPHLLADLRSWLSAPSGLASPSSPSGSVGPASAGPAPRVAFVESAIALSKPVFDGLWDKVLLVTAEPALRFSRNASASSRDSLQTFDPSRIDYTIYNNGTLSALQSEVEKFLATINAE